jgi:hypothetical protein
VEGCRGDWVGEFDRDWGVLPGGQLYFLDFPSSLLPLCLISPLLPGSFALRPPFALSLSAKSSGPPSSP